MLKKITLFVLTQIFALIIGCAIMMFLALILGYFLFGDICAKEQLEIVDSPNKNYKIVTYRENCGGATVDFAVVGELCTEDHKCKEIYDCYHEQDSYVYWIDNETVSINNKILNIIKDKYSWKNDENYYEHLYKN